MSAILLKESIIYTLGSVLTRLTGFILIPLYTYHLTVSEYGILSLLNMLLLLVTFMTLMGVSSAAARMYYDSDADDSYRKTVYGNATLILAVFPPFVVLLIGVALFPTFKHFLPNIPFFPLVITILLTGIFTPLNKLLVGLLRAQHRPVSFITFNICFFIFQAGTIIIALAVFNLGIRGQLYSQLIANIVFYCVSFYLLYKYSRPAFSYHISRRLLMFGIPLIPFFLFSWVNTSSGRFLLEQNTTLEQVGLFSLAAQFSGILLLLGTASDNALSPHFYKTANEKDGEKSLGNLVTIYIAVFGIIGLGINTFAPPIIMLIAKPEYFGAIPYIGPITLAFWFYICANPVVWSLLYVKKTVLLSKIRILSAILHVCFLVFFLWELKLGVTGVVLAMVVTNLIMLALSYFLAQRSYRLIFSSFKLTVVIVLICLGGALIEQVALGSSATNLHQLLFRMIILLVTTLIIIRVLNIHEVLIALFKKKS